MWHLWHYWPSFPWCTWELGSYGSYQRPCLLGLLSTGALLACHGCHGQSNTMVASNAMKMVLWLNMAFMAISASIYGHIYHVCHKNVDNCHAMITPLFSGKGQFSCNHLRCIATMRTSIMTYYFYLNIDPYFYYHLRNPREPICRTGTMLERSTTYSCNIIQLSESD